MSVYIVIYTDDFGDFSLLGTFSKKDAAISFVKLENIFYDLEKVKNCMVWCNDSKESLEIIEMGVQ